jgi:hypothetical protein
MSLKMAEHNEDSDLLLLHSKRSLEMTAFATSAADPYWFKSAFTLRPKCRIDATRQLVAGIPSACLVNRDLGRANHPGAPNLPPRDSAGSRHLALPMDLTLIKAPRMLIASVVRLNFLGPEMRS